MFVSLNLLKVARDDRLLLLILIVGFVVEVTGRENLIELLLVVLGCSRKLVPVCDLLALRGWLPRSFFIT